MGKLTSPAVVNLLAVGVFAALIASIRSFDSYRPVQPGVILLAIALAIPLWMSPAYAAWCYRLLGKIRRPSRHTLWIAAFAIAIATMLYIAAPAMLAGRPLRIRYYDESSYLLQTRMLSVGRLWMPQHPLADFFDTIYILNKPKYISQYFPGAALMYVWGLWMKLPYWVIPLLLTGAAAALTYVITTELLDGLAGALALVMYVVNGQVREKALMYLAQAPIMLLLLLAIFALLRWRKSARRARIIWMILIGASVGWSAITRPLDAVCIALPIGTAILLELHRTTRREMFANLFAGLCAVAPFLILQATINIGVSGSISITPFQLYAQQNNPGAGFGIHAFDPAARPETGEANKRMFFDQWAVNFVQLHQPWDFLWDAMRNRLPLAIRGCMPQSMLFALVPLGVAGVWRRRNRAVLAAIPLLVFLLYLFYTFFIPYYTMLAIPGLSMLALLGIRRIIASWRGIRHAAMPMAVLVVLTLCSQSTVELIADAGVNPADRPASTAPTDALSRLTGPAVVLFHFDPVTRSRDELVYNLDTAWPDDAPVIRANDLRQRNIEIYHYYATIQPERMFYRFDMSTGRLSRLGTAMDLAAGRTLRASSAPSTTRAATTD